MSCSDICTHKDDDDEEEEEKQMTMKRRRRIYKFGMELKIFHEFHSLLNTINDVNLIDKLNSQINFNNWTDNDLL